MSYNIDRVEVLSGQLSISVADLVRLRREHREELPANNFILAAVEQLASRDDDASEFALDMKGFTWSGEWSGNSYAEYFLEEVVPCLRGRAELVFTWARGDSTSGLLIENGKAIECDVKRVLVPRDARPSGTQQEGGNGC